MEQQQKGPQKSHKSTLKTVKKNSEESFHCPFYATNSENGKLLSTRKLRFVNEKSCIFIFL